MALTSQCRIFCGRLQAVIACGENNEGYKLCKVRARGRMYCDGRSAHVRGSNKALKISGEFSGVERHSNEGDNTEVGGRDWELQGVEWGGGNGPGATLPSAWVACSNESLIWKGTEANRGVRKSVGYPLARRRPKNNWRISANVDSEEERSK